MNLDIDKPITYIASSHRHFYYGERHVTRVCPSSVLLLVYSGILRFGENGRQIEVKSGEYYIQQAGLPQDGLIPSYLPKYYYVHFDGSFSESEGLPLRGAWNIDQVMPILDGMEGKREQGNFLLQKSLALYTVLNNLYSHQKSKYNPLAVQIMDLIVHRYRSKISVEALAKQLYISENYLIRVFKDEYGITPYRYITRLRLDKAAELLRDTERSEEEIALSVGFSDFSVFFKAFCSRYGHSPSLLRKPKTL